VEEAKAAFDLAVTDEIQAENALDNAYEALREVIGEYHQNLARLEEALPLVSPDPEDIDAWTETALHQNLDLTAARQAAEVREDEIRRVQAEGRFPKVDAFASRDYSSEGSGGFDTNRLTDTIGLQVSVPLYTGGLTGSQVREARHLYQQAVDQVEQTRRAVQRQARNAYLGVLADISRIQALQQSLTSTETALEATEAGFQVGTRTTVDVVNAQVDMFRARRDYKSARYDYVLNTLTLKLAAGTLSEEDVAYFDRFLAESAR
jgi:outer membrane protein